MDLPWETTGRRIPALYRTVAGDHPHSGKNRGGWYSVQPPSKGIIAGNGYSRTSGKCKKKGSDPPKRKPFSSRNPATIRRPEQDEGHDDKRVRGSGPKNSSTGGCLDQADSLRSTRRFGRPFKEKSSSLPCDSKLRRIFRLPSWYWSERPGLFFRNRDIS